MFLKPAQGLRVLRPHTHVPLAAEGEEVVLDKYWRRRLRDKSVVEAEPPRAPAAEEASPPAAEAPAPEAASIEEHS